MLTRCPACATTFRVRPEQLRARHGRVRCGQCGKAFNALEALFDEAGVATTADGTSAIEAAVAAAASGRAPSIDFDIPPGAESASTTPSSDDQAAGSGGPLFVLEETAPDPQALLPIPDVDVGVTELYVEGLSKRAPPSPTVGHPAEPVGDDAGEFDDGGEFGDGVGGLTLEFEIPGGSATAPTQAESGTPTFTLEEIGLDGHAPGTPPPGSEAGDDAEREPAPASERLAEDPGEPSGIPLDAPDADFPFRAADEAPPRSGLWGLGIGMLAAVLLVQSGVLFRHAVVQIVPETQPLYAALCDRIGCEMPLPRVAGFIAIESSDLHPDPTRPGRFALRATLLNRASFRQAYPHLELTLTDARDMALARRVLTPAEWRPDDLSADSFAAQGRIELQFPFEVRELKPVGYRVYAFYP